MKIYDLITYALCFYSISILFCKLTPYISANILEHMLEVELPHKHACFYTI